MKPIQTGKNFVRSYLAFIWSLFAMFFIYQTVSNPIPEGNEHVVDTVLGFVLGTVISGILMYYFGSSQSSSDKTDMMKDSIQDKSITITSSETTNKE